MMRKSVVHLPSSLILSLTTFCTIIIQISDAAFININPKQQAQYHHTISSKNASSIGALVSLRSKPKVLSSDDISESILPLMTLSSAHVIPQALNVFVQLEIPDLLGEDTMNIDDIIASLTNNSGHNRIQKDALFRILRLLASAGILTEEYHDTEIKTETDNGDTSSHTTTHQSSHYTYALTKTGALLQTNVEGQPSLVSCVQHWTEQPLWDSWLELPNYIKGSSDDEVNRHLPFDRANKMSADEYYGSNHPQSLHYANNFVRLIHDQEVNAVVNEFDWESFAGKTVVDVGGHNGKVIGAIASKFPSIDCICLDLPEVIESAGNPPPHVRFVGGNVMDSSTIPQPCDAILLKHILDKSMWSEEESLQLLKSCYSALPKDGKVIIAETVLQSAQGGGVSSNIQLIMDVQFLLVGRLSARTKVEWSELASASGFQISGIVETSSPSCSMITLTKK